MSGTCADPVTGGDTAFVGGALKPLAYDGDAVVAIRKHLAFLALEGYGYTHYEPLPNSPAFYGEQAHERLHRAVKEGSGLPWYAMGENLMGGGTTPFVAVQGWMNSRPHCLNIMNRHFTALGVGYVHEMKNSPWRNISPNNTAFVENWGQVFTKRAP